MTQTNQTNRRTINKTSASSQLMELGKMPPQAVELEEAVLGALMLENCINDVFDVLGEDSFYKPSNSIIYGIILQMYKRSMPIDILTVTQELKKEGQLEIVGGAWYITQMTNRVASSANVEFHSRIIQQKYIARELIRMCTELINDAYDESADCFELIETLEKSLTAVSKNLSVGKVEIIASLWNDVVDHNQKLLTMGGVSGVPTGYKNLDSITGGWQEASLIILAARPAMGKTSLACNFARNAAVDYNKPGVIFSLEMPARQIATRIFSLESKVSNTNFMRRGIPLDQMTFIESDCTRLINSPIYIDDTASLNLTELKTKARKLAREKNIEWIVIDYLQLMSGDKNEKKGNREQEISAISRGLKILAKELNIPIIALSQLSRQSENRPDKRPQLADLRESGAIEQDADMVIFIHRPEYYGILEDENGENTQGTAEIIFSKNRNGGIGTEKLRWIDYLTKFEAIDADHFEPSTYTNKTLQPDRSFEAQKNDITEDHPF